MAHQARANFGKRRVGGAIDRLARVGGEIVELEELPTGARNVDELVPPVAGRVPAATWTGDVVAHFRIDHLVVALGPRDFAPSRRLRDGPVRVEGQQGTALDPLRPGAAGEGQDR